MKLKKVFAIFFYLAGIFLMFFHLVVFADNPKQDKALQVIKKFGTNLKQELQAGLKKSPVEAIKICHLKAPELTQAATEDGIQIGRVSFKYRNPQNKPKPWMLNEMKAYHAGRIKTPFAIVKFQNRKEGLLKPIRTEPLCLNCHGPEIKPEVKMEIQRLYPKDTATGFKVGDIRGFFWAEY